jgi:hypothetical protein
LHFNFLETLVQSSNQLSLNELSAIVTSMPIYYTKEGDLQNAVKSNILADEIRVFHILAISNHRNHTSVESLHKKISVY